jgi:hypothetical protein
MMGFLSNVNIMVLTKKEVVDIVWQFSKYYGNQLIFLEDIKENNATAALVYLTNILENVLKSYKDDYECNFKTVIDFAYSEKVLTKSEFNFLNHKDQGIRKLRNIFAHANLSKFSYKLNDSELLYPFTENDNCELFYDLISQIIFNIICKVAMKSLIIDQEVNVDKLIDELNYLIITLTPEEILQGKGIDPKTLNGWEGLNETAQYRQAENAQHVNMLSYIFSNLKSNN